MSTATEQPTVPATATVVLHVGRQHRASEKAVVEAALARHPGGLSVEANPVAQTATARYDPKVTCGGGRGRCPLSRGVLGCVASGRVRCLGHRCWTSHTGGRRRCRRARASSEGGYFGDMFDLLAFIARMRG
jgi:hypothetical protein